MTNVQLQPTLIVRRPPFSESMRPGMLTIGLVLMVSIVRLGDVA